MMEISHSLCDNPDGCTWDYVTTMAECRNFCSNQEKCSAFHFSSKATGKRCRLASGTTRISKALTGNTIGIKNSVVGGECRAEQPITRSLNLAPGNTTADEETPKETKQPQGPVDGDRAAG